jgi:hypothetical protein
MRGDGGSETQTDISSRNEYTVKVGAGLNKYPQRDLDAIDDCVLTQEFWCTENVANMNGD